MRLLVVLCCALLSTALDDDFQGGSPTPSDKVNEGMGDGFTGHVDSGEFAAANDDQEALFGEEEKKKMDKLPPEEARRRLHQLVVRIDVNGDGILSHEEIVHQLMKIIDQEFFKRLEEELAKDDADKNGFVSFEEYLNILGYNDTNQPSAEELERVQTRFKRFDLDSDQQLQSDEYGAVNHPEQFHHTRMHIVHAYLKNFDADDDGMLSFEEYASVYAPVGKPLPKYKKDAFEQVLDKDKDGKLDQEEMERWVSPNERSGSAQVEANRLMREMDNNKDGHLTMEEVEKAFDTFLNSRIGLHHDEL